MHPHRTRRIQTRIGLTVIVLLVLLTAGVVGYAYIGRLDAEPAPLAAVREADDVTLTETPDAWVLAPTGGADDAGLVFVPGAKVDPLAYASMLRPVAAAGHPVVIVKPPLRLAIVELRDVSAFTSLVPEASSWTVGGHSLGGVKACQWAPEVGALILFASYCATDVSDGSVAVLSIAGSEDGLSTPEKIADARGLLPRDADMQVVEGASHASFGAYSAQDGDGTATISADDAHAEIAELVEGFLADR